MIIIVLDLILFNHKICAEIKTFVKIVRLLPSQELTRDMIFNSTRTIVTSLESYKDLDDLIKEIKLLYPSTLGGVDKNDITLWELSDQLLTCFEDTLLQLSSLPDNVGNRNNPLVLTYVDHNIGGLISTTSSSTSNIYLLIHWMKYNMCRY